MVLVDAIVERLGGWPLLLAQRYIVVACQRPVSVTVRRRCTPAPT
jgi:hypothetical protein